MSPPKETMGNTKGRANRIMLILDAMSAEERADFFAEVSETYCVDCGEELPDEDSKEPDHDCMAETDDEGGDEGDPDEESEDDEDVVSEP
jgi:hypothetical protein